MALRAKADSLERTADQWARGAEGERAVGAQLDLLRGHGYDVLHDVHWPGRPLANIDHVAVGPAGILVIDAKNWSGSVTLRDGVLRQNGFRRGREVDGVRRAAHDVAALLPPNLAQRTLPVLACVGGPATGDSHGVAVVPIDVLVTWVLGLPNRLSPPQVAEAAKTLDAALPAAVLPPPSSVGPKRAHPQRAIPARYDRPRRRRRKARPGITLRETVMKIALLVALLVFGPTVFAWWAENGDSVVRPLLPAPTTAPAAPVSASPSATQPAATCRELRTTFPQGVKLPGARNSGPRIRGRVTVDQQAYAANAALDQDGDGIACERKRR